MATPKTPDKKNARKTAEKYNPVNMAGKKADKKKGSRGKATENEAGGSEAA